MPPPKKKSIKKKSQRTHFLSVLTDRVHWPLYWMCERVVYLRVAFLHHIHTANVCEKFANCERIFFVWTQGGQRYEDKSTGNSKRHSFQCLSFCLPLMPLDNLYSVPIETSIIFSLSPPVDIWLRTLKHVANCSCLFVCWPLSFWILSPIYL